MGGSQSAESALPTEPKVMTPLEKLRDCEQSLHTTWIPRVESVESAVGQVRNKADAVSFLGINAKMFLEVNHHLEKVEDKVDQVEAAGDPVLRQERKRVGEEVRSLIQRLRQAKIRLDSLAGVALH
jgi:hypothetical protein